MEDRARFVIVMEVANGGELMERIVARRTFSEADASTLFRQMCTAVDWCHQKLVVVRGACVAAGAARRRQGRAGQVEGGRDSSRVPTAAQSSYLRYRAALLLLQT